MTLTGTTTSSPFSTITGPETAACCPGRSVFRRWCSGTTKRRSPRQVSTARRKPGTNWVKTRPSCVLPAWSAAKLRASGMECGLTAGWQTWAHIENYSVMHGIPYATRNNGLDGLDTRVTFNNPQVVGHIARVAEWSQDGRYLYAGRAGGSAIAAFMSGRCGMMLQSSAVYAFLKKGAKFAFDAAPVPHEPDVALQNNLIGGGTIWAMKGHKPEEYKGVAAFLDFLGQPAQQIKWHQDTGYIPLTNTAYKVLQDSGYYKEFPSQEVAIQSLTRATPTRQSMTIRVGNFAQCGAVVDEELEAGWSAKKTAQEAMDNAVRRCNDFVARFERQQKAAGR